jgi:hypothetical protein
MEKHPSEKKVLSKFIIINSTLVGILLFGITLSIFLTAKATTPNPGHPWTDIGNGLWEASNTQTSLRSFVFPDTNATILTSSSSVVLPERTVIASTTLSTSTDSVIFVDASAGAITITLPSASGTDAGLVYEVKKIDSNPVNQVTIQPPSGQTIDNITNISLANRGESALLQSDGTNWRVLLRRDYDIDSFHTRGSSSTALMQWYTSFAAGTAITTGALVANTIYAMPLIITHTTSIDQMGIDVTTASGTAEIGIYNDSGNDYPGSLLVDCGSISTANAVAVTSTTNLPITLDAGLYWMVLDASNVITIHAFPIADIVPLLGYSSLTATAAQDGWKSTFTKGSLPGTFPSTGSSTISALPFPAIFVHFAN